MKKLFFVAFFAAISIVLLSQQTFNIKIERQKSLSGNLSPISIYYENNLQNKIKGKEVYNLTGALPSDSIIELRFKMPLQPGTKIFLYPNENFTYDLLIKKAFGGLSIRDHSVYPEGTVGGVVKKDKVLPEGVSINKKTLAVSYINEKTLSSDEIRKQWVRQGGSMVGRSLSYLFTYAGMKVESPGFTTKTTIAGAGWTYTQNHYSIKIPEYKTGIATWNSFVYGYGLSANLHMSSVDIIPPPTNDFEPILGGSFLFMATGNFGYTLGVGKFKTETNYKGFAFELTYKPSLIATLSEGGNNTQINFKGVGFDITRNSFSAYANRIAPKAKSKFSFLFLPPLKNTPLMVSFGYGLVWYK